jgi:hypothetical protein
VRFSAAQREKTPTQHTKNFAVEVIDQKTKIALNSDKSSRCSLKRSIESNAQRTVELLNQMLSIH